MDKSISAILNQLDEGEINCNRAIKMINNINISPYTTEKRATRLKIYVVDGEQSVNIPAIPFGLITFLINIGFSIGSIALRYVNDLDEDTKQILSSIDSKDIKLIFKELRKHGPFDLVHVQSGDNTEVRISVL